MAISRILGTVCLALLMTFAVSARLAAKELSLSYFMSPKHQMNAAVFMPFADKLAEVSGGKLTVKMFPGGTLNSAPPQQYSRLLEGIADISFGLPGYTGQLFPVINTIAVPGTCTDAVDGTNKLWNAISLIEQEIDAKILALWTNDLAVLITKDKQVKTLEDLKGMKVRVASSQDVPFVEALGASAVSQPVSVIHQNLTNGTIDAIMIDPSAISSFKLWEPAKYITTGIPAACSAFFLLMNKQAWEGLSDEEKGWIDAASGKELSLKGGEGYAAASKKGMEDAAANGVEIYALPQAEAARFDEALKGVMESFRASELRSGVTGAQALEAMGVK